MRCHDAFKSGRHAIRLTAGAGSNQILDAEEIEKIMNGVDLPPVKRDEKKTEPDTVPDHVKDLMKDKEKRETEDKASTTDDNS